MTSPWLETALRGQDALGRGGSSGPMNPALPGPRAPGRTLYDTLKTLPGFGTIKMPDWALPRPDAPASYYIPGTNAPPLPAYTGSTGGSGGSGGYYNVSPLLAKNNEMLAATLAYLQGQLDAGRTVISDVASAASASAQRMAADIEQRGDIRSAEAGQRFIQGAEDIAARESEIAAAAGAPPGMAGVYVAPGGTADWEMLMRSSAAGEEQYVSDLSNISADEARMYALDAEQMGISYNGALVNLIAALSFQATMQKQEREFQLLAQAAQVNAQSGGGGGVTRPQPNMEEYNPLVMALMDGDIPVSVFRQTALSLNISPQRIEWDVAQYLKGSQDPTVGAPAFIRPVE